IADIRLLGAGGERCRQILQDADAGNLLVAVLRDKDHRMPGLLQVPDHMRILSGKGLMDEQQLHRRARQRRRYTLSDAAPPSPGVLAHRAPPIAARQRSVAGGSPVGSTKRTSIASSRS